MERRLQREASTGTHPAPASSCAIASCPHLAKIPPERCSPRLLLFPRPRRRLSPRAAAASSPPSHPAPPPPPPPHPATLPPPLPPNPRRRLRSISTSPLHSSHPSAPISSRWKRRERVLAPQIQRSSCCRGSHGRLPGPPGPRFRPPPAGEGRAHVGRLCRRDLRIRLDQPQIRLSIRRRWRPIRPSYDDLFGPAASSPPPKATPLPSLDSIFDCGGGEEGGDGGGVCVVALPCSSPSMEIPTAAIHRLQSFIREAGSAPSPSPAAAPAPPFPSVADAVAAFDSDASPELRCGRCGTAGGLLCGAQSAVCVYCGCPRLKEGGGVAFRDSATYRWLLGSLGLDGSVERAISVLDKMSIAGITPNEHTYIIIMRGYAANGDIGKAFEYFMKIKESGLKLDVYIYETLLRACCKSGRMQSALAVTREMSVQKIPRNSFMYNILLDGWARRGDVWEAADLMKQTKEDGVPPNIHTYTSYINACCKAGDMQRAEKVIEEMADVGLKPNLKTYTTLIKGWARASLPDRALKCFEEMKLAGLKPNVPAYHCLVTSLLSRATVMEGSTYTGILSVCREMFENDLIVDLRTAVHWSRWLHKIERTGGALTEALQRIFPPDWNSLEVLGEASDSLSTGDSDYCSDSDFSDDDEDQDPDDN